VGEKLQDNKQTENQQIEQIEFEKRMENELSFNSRIDNCYLILQKKLDGHKKDLDSVKKNRPNSLSNFVENLIINERDVSGFIDSNFYKTDFSDIYFQRLKSSLILRYTSKFDSLITNL
jgi:oligoendopeptidase F